MTKQGLDIAAGPAALYCHWGPPVKLRSLLKIATNKAWCFEKYSMDILKNTSKEWRGDGQVEKSLLSASSFILLHFRDPVLQIKSLFEFAL